MKAINLIPVAERRHGVRLTNLSPATLTVIGVLCAALLAVTTLVVIGNRTSQRHDEVAALQAQAATSAAKAATLAGDARTLETFGQSTTAARAIVATRYNWPQLFGRISRSLPSQVRLATINGTLGAATATTTAATGVTAAAGTVALTGCADSLRKVASAMQRMRRVRGVASVTLGTSSLGGGANATCPYPRSFDITVALSASAPAATGGTP